MEMNTTQNVELEEQPVAKKNDEYESFSAFAFDVLEMMAWSVLVMVLLFTFAFRICRVDGPSMENTLFDKQTLLVRSIGYTPKQDDIIIFHMTDPENNMEKTLVKRVIATEGQALEINFRTGEIRVDGVLYSDVHRVLKEPSGMYTILPDGNAYDTYTGIYSVTIPENTLFVMGDNRNHSLDSRNEVIGFVDERSVLGKVIVRLVPFDIFA